MNRGAAQLEESSVSRAAPHRGAGAWANSLAKASKTASRAEIPGLGLLSELRRAGRHALLIPWLAFAAMAGQAFADSATSAFDAANKLYAEGKFFEAASAYQQLLETGHASPALWFNLGNALFKSGQIGRSIVAYRAADQLAPRDPDVRANLQFARNQVEGPTRPASRWRRWPGTLTLNEWTGLAGAAFWVIFLLLALGQFRPGWKRLLRRYVRAATAGELVLAAGLALAWRGQHASGTAIVVEHEVVARGAPFDESQASFTAHDGAEFDLLDEKNGWLQVSDGGRHVGWLKRESVQVLGPTAPTRKALKGGRREPLRVPA